MAGVSTDDLTEIDNDDDAIEDDPTAEPAPKIPNTVLIPAILLAIIAAASLLLGTYTLTGANTRTHAAIWLPTGLVLAALVVGLWKRNRAAHALTYVIGGGVALAGIAVLQSGGYLLIAFGGGITWAISTRTAKAWFAIR